GPLAVARATRVHLALLLLAATTIPITEVALACGFTTTRQFHSAIKQFYRVTPSALRAGGRTARPRGGPARPRGHRPDGPIGAAPLTLHCEMPVRRPFDADRLLAMLADRAIPEIEDVGTSYIARTVRLPHAMGHARIDV